MFNLNEEQQRAVDSMGALTVVLAGAGSGKTSVLVAHYLKLLESGLKPHEILTVTFTTDAASELKTRIVKALELREAEVSLIDRVSRTRFIGTIHSFAYFLLTEYGEGLKLPRLENIVSDFDFQIYLELAYQNWLAKLDEPQLEQLLGLYTRRELKPLFRTLYNEKESLAESPIQNPTLALIWESTKNSLFQLEFDLRSRGLYSFQDLETLSLKLVNTVPEMLTHLQKQFKAVLIDEFQDTSPKQWQILKPLTGPQFQKLYIVGDPKQSIYSFRDADVSLFLELKSLAENSGGNNHYLLTNYRTSDPLLTQINQLSQKLFQNAEIPSSPMFAKDHGSSEFRVHSFEDSEKDAVLKQVLNLIESGSKLSDICLLFRSGDRIQDYADRLNKEKIPTSSSTVQSLFACRDILDLQSYFKALLNPKDDLALASFLHSPYVGLKWETLYSWRVPNRNSIFETLMKSKELGLDWFVSLTEQKNLSVKACLDTLFQNTQYFPASADAFLQILEPLLTEDRTLPEIVDAFKLWQLEEIQIRSKSKSLATQAVNLMTIHGAKGLEFKHILLVDTLRQSPKSLPTLLSSPDLPHGLKFRVDGEFVLSPEYEVLKEKRLQVENEEANRILYVALTRAKESIDLFFPADAKKIPKGSVAARLQQCLEC